MGRSALDLPKIFILVVAVVGLIDLINFKDPNIIQYTVFDSRIDPEEINFGQNYGGFIFGIFDGEGEGKADGYSKLDPAYGKFVLEMQEEVDEEETTITSLSIDEFTKENFPEGYE